MHGGHTTLNIRNMKESCKYAHTHTHTEKMLSEYVSTHLSMQSSGYHGNSVHLRRNH